MAQGDLRKRQKMPDRTAYVLDAAKWAAALVVVLRAQGAEDAVGVLARKARVSRHSVWSLLYRPPKSVATEIYMALGSLYAAECERQSARYSEERAATAAKTWVGRALLRAGDSLAGEQIGSLRDEGHAHD